MSGLDRFVFFAYLAGILALGALFARRQRSEGEFFLAGRSMGWFPVGLSVMVTAFSALNYTAFSGEVLQHGLYVALSLPVFVLVAFPVTRIVMPFYHDMNLCSAYEYLERRFDVRVRCLASGLFILWRIFWMAIGLLATSRILAGITGLPLLLLLALTGAAATLYTLLGGMRAVMWTDVAQFFVLFGGLIIAVCVAAGREPNGFAELFAGAAEAGLVRPFHEFDPDMFSLDPRVRITLWSALTGTFVAFLGRYSADQVVVQRYFSARSLRHAQRGFWLNVVCAVVTIGSLALLGFAVRAGMSRAGVAIEQGVPPLRYLALFIKSLPRGLAGLMTAGILAAAMSSVDSGINSCSAAFVTDFYRRLRRRPETPEAGPGLPTDRAVTLALGVLVVGMAWYVGTWRQGIFTITAKIIHGMGSPLLAIVLAGMFSRRANATGVLIGGALGALASAAVSFGIEGLALHYYAVINLGLTLFLIALAGAVASAAGAASSPEKQAWTWWARRRRNDAPARA